MPTKVTLRVVLGPMQGRDFVFVQHDVFLFGRDKDCHARLPDDNMVSRHHFVMEANPPDAQIRDLGSLNGTFVNSVKHGSREKGETPEQGAQRQYSEVALHHGDEIRVGQTTLVVEVEVDAACSQCGCSITDDDRAECQWVDGAFICKPCKRKLAASRQPPKPPEPIRCSKCKKTVADEVGSRRRGDYVCQACQAKVAQNPADLMAHFVGLIGQRDKPPSIEGLEIGKLIAVGGMGAVYLARRKRDNTNVALKLMLSKVAVTEDARKKFLREIKVTMGARHDNVVSVLDHGSAGTVFFFLMEFCEGGSVDKVMEARGGKLQLAEAAPIMLQSLAGLAHAHRQNLVHRDLKPANILLAGSAARRVAKISDFGLGKCFTDAGFSGTVTGAIAGTVPFMPREQVVNFKYCKPPTDVWSIAATFYNMLTGQFPREFRGQPDPVRAILQQPVIPLRRRDSKIPQKVAEVIDRGLHENVKERFADAGEMLAALQKAL